MSSQTDFADKATEQKITELIEQMTIDEKIGQLNQVGPSPVGGFELELNELKRMLKTGKITQKEFERETSGKCWDIHEDDIRNGRIGAFLGIYTAEKCNHFQKIAVEQSRLKIPLLFGLDVIHGYRTIFPIPLAEACTWNNGIFEMSAHIAAKEARSSGVSWTFAPMVDIARDARWGRIAEGAGEDTFLTSEYAAAKVKGFQGDNLSSKESIASCAKHFAAYGAAIGGRDYNSVDMSLETLNEIYLPPFENACKAGAATFMTAFNDINGVPCTANKYLLKDILKKNWGFNGFVVSDASSVKEIAQHGIASDLRETALKAFNSGTDMDMVSSSYIDYLKELVNIGKVSINDIDEAVRRVLRIKFKLGLFDEPYTDSSLAEKVCFCKEHRNIARDTARRSAVLLKNNGILPLKNHKKITVVGELAASKADMLGTWSFTGSKEDAVSIIDGLKNRGIDYNYSECCSVFEKLNDDELQKAISGSDIVIAVVGEYAGMSGEASSFSDISLKGEQEKMLEVIKKSGKSLITVLINGRPLAIPKTVELSDALLEAWALGSEAGNAICDILFGDYNPSGRLTVTFPNSSGECPVYYNCLPTGKPASEIRYSCKYQDVFYKPLFPFGYGLSYTDYEYSDLKAVADSEKITVSVCVENIGKITGEETVQVYVHDKVASRERPIKELKAFKKVVLKPGEKTEVILKIEKLSLGFYDMYTNYIVEPGEFEIFAGHDSSAQLKTTVVI